MFTSKERSNLRSMAQTIQPITQVGKGGISENLIKSLSDALEARELIKVSVLNNNDDDPKDIAVELAEALGAEV
ncbi:MAG: YhbY family RNA-binding protein, partial [Clostridia bacterium]|nr:YhbY family RNA-binding protein [Clostridia bacterium]